MKMTKSLRKKLLPIIFWVVLIGSFCFFTFLLILKANGYQLNYRTWRISKTGMISLNGQPTEAKVQLNGKSIKTGFPVRFSDLPPGSYEVRVSQDGFQGWSKIITVSPGKVSIYANIILFLTSAQDIKPPDDLEVQDLLEESKKNQKDIELRGAEIYFQGKLISRFSQNLFGAWLYPDREHLIFQVGSEIRAIDLDGSNNKLLFTLSSSEATSITFRSDGRAIIFVDGGNVRAKVIR